MNWFKGSKLMKQLIISFVVLTFFSIVVVTFISYLYSKNSLQKISFEKLSVIKEMKRREILQFLKDRMNLVQLLSDSEDTKKASLMLKKYHDSGGATPNGNFDIQTKEYTKIYNDIGAFFSNAASNFNFDDIFIICVEHGHIMYSVAQERDLGTNLKYGIYRDSSLAKLWANIVREKKLCFNDYTFYTPSNDVEAFIGAPLFDDSKNIYGVLAAKISIKKINEIMQDSTGLGSTGESYLVGQDLLMRTDSRFDSGSSILKKKVDTLSCNNALSKKSGTEITNDYRDVEVLSSYSSMEMNKNLSTDFEWAIISEIDKNEAFDPVYDLENKMIIAGIIMLILSIIVGFVAASSIAKPLVEGANTLASSVSEISSTSTQLASSSTQTSTSIAEISSTAEEVRQTVQVSNEKAGEVVERSRKVNQIAEAGKKSTEDTINGIKRIKEEMEYIAESIVKLSEQTQSIGQIIGAVTDLADQSNLLSVNASIEAAKAGDHGKGFAVVAQEVKSLAEQSKEATNQVQIILNDIQKATSSAVLATERGGKAVEAGVSLSAQAGEAITTLAKSVSESSNAALQIASSSHQQLTGIEQLAQAMDNIKEISVQNVEGARQLDEAIKNLNSLAEKLKGLAA